MTFLSSPGNSIRLRVFLSLGKKEIGSIVEHSKRD